MPVTLALAAFALLTLVHAGAQSMALKSGPAGKAWAEGPRDSPPPASLLENRLSRAMRNFLETAPAFLALMLATHITRPDGTAASVIGAGTALYLVARALYLPAYATGRPRLRRLSWLAAGIGLAAMLIGVLAA